MVEIEVRNPSSGTVRKFTISDPPFPAIGEMINGIGQVIKITATEGFTIYRGPVQPTPGRAKASRTKKSKSTEAKTK
jgi:hypothetical protein